uniref:Small vcp/p97-interacting protein n=1 Tax=Panstrongylus lignarius TaxID=156445 RepID=A0A224Y4V9_9HEMI
MGIILSCCKSADEDLLTPDAETRRKLQAEAAEKRSRQAENRGIKDPAKVQRLQKKAEELERREQEAMRSGNTNAPLRWQMN